MASHCVVIPVFNHALTVQRVVRGAREVLPTLVVNDGSTDATARLLAGEEGITLLTLPRNRGKGAALRAGFARALGMGFTHAITLDADGQHATEALKEFADASRRQPDAFIVGVRDLRKAGAPAARRASNALSNFWFRFETGVPLPDTQCGYRCYPLAAVQLLRLDAERYAFELEILVKASWAGFPLVGHEVEADYAAPTSRLSHFHPWRDLAAISWLHACLALEAFCLPAPLLRLLARGDLHRLPRKRRLRTILALLFSDHAGTPGRLAGAVGVGLFCGFAPIWGFQMLTAAALAHKFRLNKAIALAASNISSPPLTPFVIAAGLIFGHFLRTGGLVRSDPGTAAQQAPLYLWEWVLGSLALGLLVGAVGGLLTFAIAWLSARKQSQPQTNHV